MAEAATLKRVAISLSDPRAWRHEQETIQAMAMGLDIEGAPQKGNAKADNETIGGIVIRLIFRG